MITPIPPRNSLPADTREIIARSQPTDYDGHTEFGRMTPAERLAWLDAAVAFIETRRAGGLNAGVTPTQIAELRDDGR
jgi:hypothetical protein